MGRGGGGGAHRGFRKYLNQKSKLSRGNRPAAPILAFTRLDPPIPISKLLSEPQFGVGRKLQGFVPICSNFTFSSDLFDVRSLFSGFLPICSDLLRFLPICFSEKRSVNIAKRRLLVNSYGPEIQTEFCCFPCENDLNSGKKRFYKSPPDRYVPSPRGPGDRKKKIILA